MEKKRIWKTKVWDTHASTTSQVDTFGRYYAATLKLVNNTKSPTNKNNLCSTTDTDCNKPIFII